MCACYSFYTNLYVLISAKTCFTVKTTAQAARVITSGYEAPFSRCCVCGGGEGGATPPQISSCHVCVFYSCGEKFPSINQPECRGNLGLLMVSLNCSFISGWTIVQKTSLMTINIKTECTSLNSFRFFSNPHMLRCLHRSSNIYIHWHKSFSKWCSSFWGLSAALCIIWQTRIFGTYILKIDTIVQLNSEHKFALMDRPQGSMSSRWRHYAHSAQFYRYTLARSYKQINASW